MSGKTVIFISSVQKELSAERRALKDYIDANPLLRKFFEVFLFEDLPASDRRADDVYLAEVARCGIYLGLFGKEYGPENEEGLSATEREFDRATTAGKTRLIYLMGKDDGSRHPKMVALIRKAGPQLIRRRIAGGVPQLTEELLASLVEHLERQGAIEHRGFEERPCPGAASDDLEGEAVTAFVRRARNARKFPLAEGTPVADVLTHLHLLADGKVSNAAMLLFGRDPQKFVPCAEIRCMHFHGTEVQRPVPFYRVFKGRLFDQVDQAADFVLSKVNRSVGTRAEGPRAPVRSELPEDVVAEAIVNAVAHRDYTTGAAIQVSVFADRVEVWNPGELLPPLTPESLRRAHRSVLRNPRIAEALFLAHYIEKYGTGTLMMIRESREHALPEPSFGGSQPGEFGTTIWRDWLTEEVMAGLGLNERQRKAVAVVKREGRITNAVYQRVAEASRPTAIRDLADLTAKKVFTRHGMGRSSSYVLAGKRVRNDSNDSRQSARTNDSEMTQTTHGPRMQTRHEPVKRAKKRDTKGTMRTSGSMEGHDLDRAKGAPKGHKGHGPTKRATKGPKGSKGSTNRKTVKRRPRTAEEAQ